MLYSLKELTILIDQRASVVQSLKSFFYILMCHSYNGVNKCYGFMTSLIFELKTSMSKNKYVRYIFTRKTPYSHIQCLHMPAGITEEEEGWPGNGNTSLHIQQSYTRNACVTLME